MYEYSAARAEMLERFWTPDSTITYRQAETSDGLKIHMMLIEERVRLFVEVPVIDESGRMVWNIEKVVVTH